MIVTEVTVSIHEKRNHPYEYGHYDASVGYTAKLSEDDDPAFPGFVTTELIFRARSHVIAECDRWIAAVEEERRLDEIESALQRYLNDVERGYRVLKYAKRLLREAAKSLPPDRYECWRDRLRWALAERNPHPRKLGDYL